MSTVRNATLALLAFMPLLGACQQAPVPTPAGTPGTPATALGKVVEEATQEARTKLANEPSTLASDMSPCPHIAFITLYA